MTTQSSKKVQALKQKLKRKGVRYAIAGYVDMHGVSKGKNVPIEYFDRMMGGSELCTGAALDGVPQEVNDEEVSAHPDPDSAMILPWNREVVWFASDLWCEGKPFEPCSRNILRRQREKAAKMGFIFNLGIETEFFVLREDESGEYVPVSEQDNVDKPVYDTRLMLHNYGWLDEVVSSMNELGWGVFSFDKEDTNGQWETDFAYADALTMSDRFTFFRLMVKEICRNHGLLATFMPKPWSDRTGSGAHYNMSLADKKTGKNLFKDPKDKRKCGFSKLGYQFIAGILKHAEAIAAITCPTVNSYKRLVIQGSMTGFTWAPAYICYGGNNRTNMLRIPLGGERVESRAADIACNAYLGSAMMLAAGLEGIKNKIDPGEPHMENVYVKTPAQLKREKIRVLPRNLEEAMDSLEADPLSEKVLGPAMLKAIVDFRRQEWKDYHNHISDWERKRYLNFY
ncbi:MAG: type III glutamate--ammonia ligase [Proteobacteria bacterium]|nr:type III glutamate--ammonia ligase [Pseudomonadota bacterium]